ncbi:MAG: hypothetical protein LUE24_01315 [Lachnospiraceae bacterium]|nr:hypothetical protein [Lachnospiraceae bacterium]
MAIEGLEILMSRLDGLSRLLRTQNIESDLLGGLDGDLPKLFIYLEAGDAYLSCVPMDQDDSMEHFVLDLGAEIRLPDMSYVKRQTLCDMFSRISMGGMAYLSEADDSVFYRWVLPEAVLPTSEETFLYFISLYAEYYGVLREFAERISAASETPAGET